MSTQCGTNFLDLPRELRDLIYDCYFSLKYESPMSFIYCEAGFDDDSPFDSTLNYVSKAVKEEASEFLYSTSRFNINSDSGVWTPSAEQIRIIKHFGASLEMKKWRTIPVIPPEYDHVLSILVEGAHSSKSCNLKLKLSQWWRDDIEEIRFDQLMTGLRGYGTLTIELEWDQSVPWKEKFEWNRSGTRSGRFEPPAFTTFVAKFRQACRDTLGLGEAYEIWNDETWGVEVHKIEYHPAGYVMTRKLIEAPLETGLKSLRLERSSTVASMRGIEIGGMHLSDVSPSNSHYFAIEP